jgi:hypothetical protein
MAKYLAALLLVPLLILNCSGKSPETAKTLLEYFPKSGDVSGWNAVGEPKEYIGDDLYTLINGGAEIYHEYGFKSVAAQEFSSANEKSAIIEIFEMTNPESAFGIYSFKTGTKGVELPVSNDGLLESYYLNFWKGRFVITITGFGTDNETVDGIKAFAQVIDKNITQKGEPPSIVSLLPKTGLNKFSINVFNGHLGLYNSYPFDTRNIFEFRQAVKGRYNDAYDLYIFQYDDENSCKLKYESAKNSLKNNAKYVNIALENDEFGISDQEGRLLYFRPAGKHICLVLGAGGQDESVKILNEFESNLK